METIAVLRRSDSRMKIVRTEQLVYEYQKYDDQGNPSEVTRAIDGVDLQVEQGQFIAVLGHNGSGKSTLAKHLNALLLPSGGTVWVEGKDTALDENLWDVRQTAGMVFRIRTIRSSLMWWRRMWDSVQKTWAFPQRRYGSGWMTA